MGSKINAHIWAQMPLEKPELGEVFEFTKPEWVSDKTWNAALRKQINKFHPLRSDEYMNIGRDGDTYFAVIRQTDIPF